MLFLIKKTVFTGDIENRIYKDINTNSSYPLVVCNLVRRENVTKIRTIQNVIKMKIIQKYKPSYKIRTIPLTNIPMNFDFQEDH